LELFEDLGTLGHLLTALRTDIAIGKIDVHVSDKLAD
jgi:hypothetical protein